jgi:hypothetical protein
MAQAAPGNVYNGYLQNTLLIGDPALITALNMQGLNDFNDFVMFEDEDVHQICVNIWKPGGVIPNPRAGGRGRLAHIPNPGNQVGHVFEKRLKMLCYFANHLRRVQRQMDVNVATLAKLAEVYQLKEQDEDDDDVVLPAPPDVSRECSGYIGEYR